MIHSLGRCDAQIKQRKGYIEKWKKKEKKKARNKDQSASAQYCILIQQIVVNAEWSFSERLQKIGISTDSPKKAREHGRESETANHHTFSSLPPEGR